MNPQASVSPPTPAPRGAFASAPDAAPPGPPAAADSGIAVCGLEKTYQRGPVRVDALRDVTLTLERGSQVGVMGPSGSGKTTLLHCLAGVIRPTSGSILVEGSEIVGLKERQLSQLRLTRFGFVFQDGQLLPELSALENVALPLMLAGEQRRSAQDRAGAALGALGLAGETRARPGQLSGGQAQRVAIARAMVTNPQVVFADEPTGALDRATGQEVMGVLTSACRASGATLVVVTHDPAVAAWCQRILQVCDGRVHEGAPALVDPGATGPGASDPALGALR